MSYNITDFGRSLLTVCMLPSTQGTDPEYLQEAARIEEERDKRLFVAESFRAYETQCVKEEFEREKSLSETEFEVRVDPMVTSVK